MSVKVTPEQVTEALKAAVAERGEDYVYPDKWKQGSRCLYVQPDGTGPACIVGEVAFRLGVTLPQLRMYEGSAAVGVAKYLLGLTSYPTAIAALAEAQERQDAGGTWGEALEDYLDALGESVSL